MIIEKTFSRVLFCVGLGSFLMGCASGSGLRLKDGSKVALSARIDRTAQLSETRRLIEKGVAALDEGAHAEANACFNQALKLDTTSSPLHFLNGLAYHLQALNGDASLFEMAEQGYQLAVKFDSTHWQARYHLGLLFLDQKKYVPAQEQLAEALLFNDHDRDLLYSMVVASYYARDPVTADGALERLRAVEGDTERALRAFCMVKSALGDEMRASEGMERYSQLFGVTADADHLGSRMADWNKLHGYMGKSTGRAGVPVLKIIPASYDASSNDTGGSSGSAAGEGTGSSDEPVAEEKKMVIVDVVMVRTEENITTRKGINLLNGLAVQFGSNGNPAFSWSENRRQDGADNPWDVSKTITRALNVPAINYSLNIFNTHSDRAEVLARPTLVAMDGEQSTFFSGLDIQAATVGDSEGGYGGGSVQISQKVGVTLEITPTFLDDKSIKLRVHAQRRFLHTPSEDIVFENKIETSETDVSANVLMNFGETLVLSGLSEKETERIRDGVPLLQDLPGVQYLFSRKDSRDFQRSVLILLTPRPPQYVYREADEGQRGSGTAGKRSSLSELQARYSDWFKPYPNWASAFHHMQSNSLYREFRTGDVTLERWANQQSLGDRLRQALDFLYY